MFSAVDDSEKAVSPKVIRDKAFAKRLELACERNSHCPTNGRGKQKWLYDLLAERFGTKVSAEAARKWFAGESRPRPNVMRQVAQILEVDEAWLSLGITPDETPQEKKKRNAIADGAVNYIAGLIQMAGGSIAFPDNRQGTNHQPDMFAIINGRQHVIEVKRAQAKDGSFRVRVAPESLSSLVMVVVDGDGPGRFDVLKLPPETISKQGKSRGGFIELALEKSGSEYSAGGQPLAHVVDFARLDT